MTRIATILTVATLGFAAPFAASAESIDAANDPTVNSGPASMGSLIETTRGTGFGAWLPDFGGSDAASYSDTVQENDHL